MVRLSQLSHADQADLLVLHMRGASRSDLEAAAAAAKKPKPTVEAVTTNVASQTTKPLSVRIPMPVTQDTMITVSGPVTDLNALVKVLNDALSKARASAKENISLKTAILSWRDKQKGETNGTNATGRGVDTHLPDSGATPVDTGAAH